MSDTHDIDADRGSEDEAGGLNLDLVMDVPVTMQVVLGSTTMTVAKLLDLGRGALVKLETKVGEPVDLIVNGRIVARGELVVLDDDDQKFGITLTEVAQPGAPLASRTKKAA